MNYDQPHSQAVWWILRLLGGLGVWKVIEMCSYVYNHLIWVP